MLAYLSWHWPRDSVGNEAYEEGSLPGFYETLAMTSPEGFRGSATFRIEGTSWLDSGPRAYEDWYLLDGTFALEPLNEAAVSGKRRQPHDERARAPPVAPGGHYSLDQGQASPHRLPEGSRIA